MNQDALLAERIEHHTAFWQGTMKAPMLGVFVPDTKAQPYACVDIDLPIEAVVAKSRATVEWANQTPDQRLPRVWANFGPVLSPALAGGNVSWDEDTSWSESSASSMDDVAAASFHEEHPLWANFAEKFRALCDEQFPGTLVSINNTLGPFDILSALAGNETLCIECLVNPEKVAQAASACTDFFLEMHDRCYGFLPKVEGVDGVATIFGMFCPGKGGLLTEDFCALCGPDIYRDLILPTDLRIAEALDTCYMHVHSAGAACLEHILTNPHLNGVEISNDPNGPPLEAILDWANEAYRHGKSVMLSNWECHLTQAEVKVILSRIDPSRTVVTVDAEDLKQAELWAEMFRLGT